MYTHTCMCVCADLHIYIYIHTHTRITSGFLSLCLCWSDDWVNIWKPDCGAQQRGLCLGHCPGSSRRAGGRLTVRPFHVPHAPSPTFQIKLELGRGHSVKEQQRTEGQRMLRAWGVGDQHSWKVLLAPGLGLCEEQATQAVPTTHWDPSNRSQVLITLEHYKAGSGFTHSVDLHTRRYMHFSLCSPIRHASQNNPGGIIEF